MKYNFSKKHLTTIVIIIIIIICIIIITTIIFLYRKSKNNNNKQKLELPILEQKNQEPIYEEQNKESQSFKKEKNIILPTSSDPFESIHNYKTKETGLNAIESPLKETIKILLPNSSNFQKTFTEWCNTNNYNNLPILNKKEVNKIAIIESNYFNAHFDAKVTNLLVEGTVQIFDITHTETPLPLKQIEEYCNQLAAWMYRCDYKPDRDYNQHEVRNLLGRSSRYLCGITDVYQYFYKPGIFSDDWSIDNQKINGSYYRSSKYLSRQPAPKKPDCLTINEIKKCSDQNFALKFPIEDK